jgi:hypothetical protein
MDSSFLSFFRHAHLKLLIRNVSFSHLRSSYLRFCCAAMVTRRVVSEENNGGTSHLGAVSGLAGLAGRIPAL